MRRSKLFAAAAAVALVWAAAASTVTGVVSPTAAAAEAGTTAAGDTVVWVTGDACDNDNAAVDCADVGRLIAADSQKRAVLALGDLQYEKGTLAEFRTYYDPKMGAGPGLKSLTFPVVGNHEYYTPGAAGYFDYWGARAGDRTKGYYATTLGGWRLIAANSNCAKVGGCGASSPQGTFIRAQLSSAGSCALVFGHHPPFTDGSVGDASVGKALFTLAYNGRADLFLSGHSHVYERFAPRRPDGTVDRTRGVPSFVVGVGGNSLNSFRSTKRSEYRQNTKFGALRLVLSPGGYTSKFMSVAGTLMDTSSGTCH